MLYFIFPEYRLQQHTARLNIFQRINLYHGGIWTKIVKDTYLKFSDTSESWNDVWSPFHKILSGHLFIPAGRKSQWIHECMIQVLDVKLAGLVLWSKLSSFVWDFSFSFFGYYKDNGLQGYDTVQSGGNLLKFPRKVDRLHSSEVSVNFYWTTWCCVPEECNLQGKL